MVLLVVILLDKDVALPVAVPVADKLVVVELLLLAADVDDEDDAETVEEGITEEAVDPAACEHTLGVKRWRMINKGMGRCRFIVRVNEGTNGQPFAGPLRGSSNKQHVIISGRPGVQRFLANMNM